MKQLEFEDRYSAFWDTMETVLKSIGESVGKNVEKEAKHNSEQKNSQQYNAEALAKFPKDYRRLCQHLAMAKSRRYAPELVTRLNTLVQQGYEVLYGQSLNNKASILEFLVYGFPAALRANARFLWVSGFVFVLPYAAIMIACMVNAR